MDLHAHSSNKSCFIYGNVLTLLLLKKKKKKAMDDFASQVESQLFAKLTSMNCINFDYD